MTMSWHMMVEFEPPLIACIVSSADYSFRALKVTRECVIAIPARRLPRRLLGLATAQGAKLISSEIRAEQGYRPAGSRAFGCRMLCQSRMRVVNMKFVRTYNLFILEAIKAWIFLKSATPHYPSSRRRRFVADGARFVLKSAMR